MSAVSALPTSEHPGKGINEIAARLSTDAIALGKALKSLRKSDVVRREGERRDARNFVRAGADSSGEFQQYRLN